MKYLQQRSSLFRGSLALAALTAFAVFAAAPASVRAQTKADSGWVPLFNGKDFDGFYTHFYTIGVIDITKQDAFLIDSGMIHVPRSKSTGYTGNQGHLFTRKEYSWYKVRVEYRFAANEPGGSQNAGLIVHVNNAQALVDNIKERRPRSIEINMRRAESHPWTLYSATGLGPYITTTVRNGTNLFLSKAEGGVEWTNDPWGERIIASSYPNPERPMGEWNRGEAHIYGDSLGLFFLNGQLRTSGWNFKLRGAPNDASVARRVPCASGGIGLQGEVHEIWYRNFEIMELEPHTKRPLHAKTTALAGGKRPTARKSEIARVGTWKGRTVNGRRLPQAIQPSQSPLMQQEP